MPNRKLSPNWIGWRNKHHVSRIVEGTTLIGTYSVADGIVPLHHLADPVRTDGRVGRVIAGWINARELFDRGGNEFLTHAADCTAVLTLLTGCFQHVSLAPRPPKPVGMIETGKWTQLIARTDPQEFDRSRVVIFGDVDHYGKPVIRYAYEQCGDLKPMICDGLIT